MGARITKWQNYELIIAASGRITTDADQSGEVERHIEDAFGNPHTTTNHGSRLIGLGVHFTEEGKPEKNHRSTGETNYNNSIYMSSKFFENQHEAIPRWPPIQL